MANILTVIGDLHRNVRHTVEKPVTLHIYQNTKKEVTSNIRANRQSFYCIGQHL